MVVIFAHTVMRLRTMPDNEMRGQRGRKEREIKQKLQQKLQHKLQQKLKRFSEYRLFTTDLKQS